MGWKFPSQQWFESPEFSSLEEAELFIRDQRLTLGRIHRAVLGWKGPLWAYHFLFWLCWSGNQTMEREERRCWAAQEATLLGNRPLLG